MADNFAYVHFLNDGVKMVVPLPDIQKFDPTHYDPNKAYRVRYLDGHHYRAYVLCVGTSEADVEERLKKKRMRVPLKKFDESADDSTEVTETEHLDCDLGDHISTKAKSKIVSKAAKVAAYAASNFIDVTKKSKSVCKTGNETSTGAVHAATKSSDVIQIPRQIHQSQTSCANKSKDLPADDKCKCEAELRKISIEVAELRTLNRQLQNDVIAKFKDSNWLRSQADNSSDSAEATPPVAFKKNGQVHLGQDVWIPSHTFDTISLRKPQKDGLFIKDMATAVFGEVTLMSSSVTGAICNRFKNTERKPPLNASKLLAISDILKHRLEKRGERDILNIMNSVNQRIAEKIQDLNRQPRIKKPENKEAALDTVEEGENNLQKEVNAAIAVLQNDGFSLDSDSEVTVEHMI